MDSGSQPALIERSRRGLFLGAASLIAMILAVNVVVLGNMRNNTLRAASDYLGGYSNVVAEHAETTFRSIDIVLSSLADYLARNGVNDADGMVAIAGQDATHRFLKEHLAGLPFVSSFMLVDTRGHVVASSLDAPPAGVNLSDRDYFRALRDDPNLESFISQPIVSRITGGRVVLLSRRLSDPNGAFMGLMVGTANQRAFEDYYAATVAGGDTRVALIRTDGVIIAAHEPARAEPAAPMRFNLGLRDHDNATADDLTAQRRVANFPVTVTVAQAKTSVLGEWRRAAWLISGFSACSALLIAAFSVVSLRRQQAQAAFLAKLEESEAVARLQSQQFAATLANLPQGLCMFDEDGRIVVANAQYARLYDLLPEDVTPGTALETVVERRIAWGCYPGGDADAYRKSALRHATEDDGAGESALHHLPNGKVIAVTRYPMPDGGWVAQHTDVTDEHRSMERIHFLAHHDSLTQLVNRSQLIERMSNQLAEMQRGLGPAVCIHLLDLDMFKAVNDTLGHGAGDKLLQQVGERLRAATRDIDVVARLGGDEFAVMQCVDAAHWREDALSLAERLLGRIAEPYLIDGHNVVVGTSIGAACAPEDGLAVDELMSKADLALYKAKASGRNALRFYDETLESEARQRHNLQLDLHQAIAAEQFELLYQPIVAAQSGAIVGAEALVRWRHPRDGLISPDKFIPVAEETGVIVALGEWILLQACRDALTWPPEMRVAVNISPVQFQKGDLKKTVERVLAETGLPVSRLELEITEGVFLRNSQESLSIIQSLKKLGVSFALDDFGTGYSSLAYVRAFPLDKIKIDKSFVSEALQRPDCAAIIAAIVHLARRLDIETVAEGVETEEQRAFVRAAGCTYFQGYLFGRPVETGFFSNLCAAEPFLRAANS